MCAKKVDFTEALKTEYTALIAAAHVNAIHLAEVDSIVKRIFRPENWVQYQQVSQITKIPPHVIAIIHSLEASGRFDRHLHNGDPLTARTKQVPSGRPKTGSPPFTWVESAVDALDETSKWTDWSLTGIAYVFERYNGWGYRLFHSQVKSPYLWSYTNIYTSGKYVQDGKWSDSAVSKQCGAMALLIRMIETGKVTADLPKAEQDDTPQAAAAETVVVPPPFPGKMIRTGARGDAVTRIQQQLKSLGIIEGGAADGDFGEKTEWAVKLFQARHEDSTGEPLEIDGVVGPQTWNSLFGIEPTGDVVEASSEDGASGKTSALDIAKSQLGIVEQPKGSNRGPEVDMYLSTIDPSLKGQPWCMAFVYWCFQQAASANGTPVIAPKTASVWRSWELAQSINGIKILSARDARADPDSIRPGMVFYIDTGGRSGHTGFVADIVNGKLVTVEGNTNNDGSREGYGVFQRSKRRIDQINLGFIDFG